MTDLGLPRPVGKYALLRSLDEADPRGEPALEPPSALAVTAPRSLEVAPARGVLYLAAESALDKPRAVLVLPASPSSRPDLEGVRQLCGLVHPNLLQVLEGGRTEDELFAASEWLVGCSLAELVARAAEKQVRIPIAVALYLAREVARGLHAAHMHGGSLAAHGGVAPGNILCGEGGEVKLMHRERLEQLLAGSLKATGGAEASAVRPLLPPLRVRPYQAADQAWGAPPTPQGDIYALGAVLWELLTGRRLHEEDPGLSGLDQVATVGSPRAPTGGEVEVEADPLDATAPQPGLLQPPSAYARELPPTVDALVLRALDPRPEERFASVEELRQGLSRELARLASEHSERDGGGVAALLHEVLGDELAQKRAEQDWLIESARILWPRGRGPASGVRSESAAPGFPERQSPFPSSAALVIPPELAKTQLGPPRRPVQSPEERLDREQLIDGRYRLRRLIGVGGMGAVYEAEHTAICKRVALKILHPQFSKHADLVERLRREAQAASRIGHPNIVDVTDFGRTEDGSAYLAMEYLHGTDLGAILRARGRLAEPRTLHVGVQLVRALAAAHRVGIIHRDLKPENVFLVDPLDWTEAEGARPEVDGVPSQGQDLVKVLDFGIAMQAESMPRPQPRAARLTSPGLTVGTPEYMAPEQAMGLKVDPRADIYAVGTMLYEMLCARVPFIAGSVPELLTLKTCQDAPPPHLWLPAISPAFEAVIMRCLLRDPAARPQSMEELERELILLAAEQGIVVDPMRSGGLLSRGHYRGGERKQSGTPAAVTRGTAPVARPSASRPSVGRVAVAAGGDSDSRLQPLEQVTDLYGGTAPDHLVATVAGSAVTAPPHWTARFRRTLIGTVLAVGMVVIGFTSARFVPRRARPVPPPAQPALPSAALESVPVVALRPAGLPVAPATAASELVERAAGPLLERRSEPPPAENHTAMLTEWARRAAAAGRYIAPPGDNLVELLKRIEAVAPDNPELGQLRAQAAATLNTKAREQLRRRHTLAALDSYRALQALQPQAPFPRAELAVQLAATARAVHKGTQATELAQTAVELAPGLAVTHLALGDTLLLQGQRAAAAVEYRRTLALLPQGSESRQALRGLARTAHNPPAHGKHGHR